MLSRIKRVSSVIFFTVLFILALSFAVGAVDIGEDITIEYYKGEIKGKNYSLDKDYGSEGITIIQAGTPITLPTKKNLEEGKSFDWYTDDGRMYAGGETVVFYENMKLRQVESYEVTTFEKLKEYVRTGKHVKLLCDIEGTSKVGVNGETNPIINLNGHSIYLKHGDTYAWGGQRCGSYFIGAGEITFESTKSDALGKTYFIQKQSHGWYGDNNCVLVGRDVIINCRYSFFAEDGDQSVTQGYPLINIYGTVNAYGILVTRHPTNRNASIYIYDGAVVNISGIAVKREATADANTTHLNIYGGTINSNGNGYSFFNDSLAVYNIQGGAFNFAIADDKAKLEGLLDKNKYYTQALLAENGITYTIVLPIECSHNISISKQEEPTCLNTNIDHYSCSRCEYTFRIGYGELADHSWNTQTEYIKPTKTTLGIVRHKCDRCGSGRAEYIMYNPEEDVIKIKVLVDGNEKEMDVKVGDLFLTESPTLLDVVLKELKDFTVDGVEYKADQVVEITIPVGITKIEITKENSSVKTVTIDTGDVFEIEVKKMTNFKVIDKIIVKNAIVEFGEYVTSEWKKVDGKDVCLPNTLTTIDATSKGATVTFAKNAFNGSSSLENLLMVTGSTYNFGENSFRSSGIKALYFPDYAVVNFTGAAAFYTSEVKEVYVGRGITQLNNKPFDCARKLEKLVLMDVVQMSEYSVCVAEKSHAAESLTVYIHSDTMKMDTNNVFYRRKNVTIYTNAMISQGFNDVNGYVIHYGIPHAYTPKTIAPTCTSIGYNTFETDCPCGEFKNASYKVFTNKTTSSSDYGLNEYIETKIPMIPHTYSQIGEISYLNGYTSVGQIVHKCKDCTATDVAKEIQSFFTAPGYSARESAGAVLASYIVNFDSATLLKEYYSGLDYGIVICPAFALEGGAPLDSNGNTTTSRAMKISFADMGRYYLSFKVSGLSDSLLDTELVMSAYIVTDGGVQFVDSTGTFDTPNAVSYNEIAQLVSSAIYYIPSDEE